ncbi:hypothetical protein CICLE_v10006381mg [Citrus x clementina]|uniref:Uncharacterized protein n=1 Tax=Citrus clementina TaxID=85681 RepID=V4SDF6_CITCL|nr:hypothetical protein CICLE_v10006381mg [Citrus x clementina]GAY41320.1 hypothetical protein CUMW_058540 [Citrus unshiu]
MCSGQAYFKVNSGNSKKTLAQQTGTLKPSIMRRRQGAKEVPPTATMVYKFETILGPNKTFSIRHCGLLVL